MMKNALICPTDDIGSGLRIEGAELLYSYCLDAKVACNVALRCHNPPTGIHDGLVPEVLIKQRNLRIILCNNYSKALTSIIITIITRFVQKNPPVTKL